MIDSKQQPSQIQPHQPPQPDDFSQLELAPQSCPTSLILRTSLNIQDSQSNPNLLNQLQIISNAPLPNQQLISSLSLPASPFPLPYKNIKILNLGANNIQSIHNIGRIFMPNLQQLHLFKNSISSLRIAKHLFLPRLRYINLVQNFITDLSQLPLLYSQSLEHIWLYNNLLVSGLVILKIQGKIGGCSLGWPDQNLGLQIGMCGKWKYYTPIQESIWEDYGGVNGMKERRRMERQAARRQEQERLDRKEQDERGLEDFLEQRARREREMEGQKE